MASPWEAPAAAEANPTAEPEARRGRRTDRKASRNGRGVRCVTRGGQVGADHPARRCNVRCTCARSFHRRHALARRRSHRWRHTRSGWFVQIDRLRRDLETRQHRHQRIDSRRLSHVELGDRSGRRRRNLCGGCVWAFRTLEIDRRGRELGAAVPAQSEFAKVVQYTFASNVSMDPHDHKHLVVGTHANCAAPYDPVCQAESSDAGATWKIVRIPNPTGGWVERTGPYAIDATSWLYATPGTGIFLTTDHGATWNNATPKGVTGAAGGEFTHHPLFASPLGHYYLPGAPSGLLRSNDGHSWSLMPGTTLGGELCVAMGGGKLYMADFNSGSYRVAVESDTPQWTTFPSPFTVGGGKQGPIFLEYDEAHHILYSSNFTGGVWRVRLIYCRPGISEARP